MSVMHDGKGAGGAVRQSFPAPTLDPIYPLLQMYGQRQAAFVCWNTHRAASGANDNWRVTYGGLAQPVRVVCPDAGTDDGTRTLALSAAQVKIARRVRGVGMDIKLPPTAFKGVALRLEPRGDFGWHYRLVLEHADEGLASCLYSADHDLDVVALWRRYAKILNLPRLVEHDDGTLAPVEDVSDIQKKVKCPNALKAFAFARRKVKALTKQRPRFLRRRKSSKLPLDPVVVRGEVEIVARS